MAAIFVVEGLPYVVDLGVSTIDLLPRLAEVVVDFAGIRNVAPGSIRMSNMGRRWDVIVPRAPESPPSVICFPVPCIY